MEAEKKKQSAIVLYPSPGRAHLNPVVELSKLMVNGHPSLAVIIITSSLPPDSPSLRTYASSVSISNQLYPISFIHLEAPPLPSGSDDGTSSSSRRNDPFLATHEFVASLFEIPKLNNPALHETLLALSQEYDIRAFVMDYFCHFALEVPSGLGLPTYYFTTMGAFVAGLLLITVSSIDKTISGSLKDLDPSFLVECLPGVPPIPRKDVMVVLNDRSHRVYGYMVDAAAGLSESKGFALNTFEALEKRILETILVRGEAAGDPKLPPVYCVGPLVTPYDGAGGDHECLTWLDSQPSRSVLFLCFGRFGTFSSRQLKEVAVGLERSGARFLWVVRNPPEMEIASEEEVDLETLLPLGFMERTKERGLVVKKWAPQFQVLNHGSVGGFLTHCGWNSVMEGVCAGVPMLTWPLYAEQKMNRVYLVEVLEMALGLREEEDGTVSAGELEEKVTELMSSEKGKEMRERASLMKQAALEAVSDGGFSRVAIAKLVNNSQQ